jgi:hypothetical protein
LASRYTASTGKAAIGQLQGLGRSLVAEGLQQRLHQIDQQRWAICCLAFADEAVAVRK